MIPETTLYASSTVTPSHSRADIEDVLEKFGVKKFMWQRETPEDSFLVFAKHFDGIDDPIVYKVSIPFVEKMTGPRSNKIKEYDEIRSYRILFYILKHLLLNTDVGMTFEQVFSSYTVVEHIGGKFLNIMERMGQKLMEGKNPQADLQLGFTPK